MDATNRDIFISEFIIHYLQSRYPNKYSDQTIVNKYKEYKKLRILKEVSDQYEDKDDGLNKMSDFDLNRLKDLHEYFYGTSDGSNPSSGNNIARDYQIVLSSVKHIIEENDNAIKDIVSNITSLLETSSADSTNSDIAKIYLEKVVIEPLIIALESSFDEELKISKPVLKVNDISEKSKQEMFKSMVVAENQEIKDKKNAAKAKKEADIKKRKDENEKKDAKTREENEKEAKKAKKRLSDKDIRSIFGKLTTCFNESKNLMKEDIYIEAIKKYSKKYLTDPQTLSSNEPLKNLNEFFKEIISLNVIKTNIEDEKKKKIAQEDKNKLNENLQLAEKQLKSATEKHEKNVEIAENEIKEAETALFIEGLNDPQFMVKFNNLTLSDNIFYNIKTTKENITQIIDDYINGYRDYISRVNRIFDELIAQAKKQKNSPPTSSEDIDKDIEKLTELKQKFKKLVETIKNNLESYKQKIESKNEQALIDDIKKKNSLSKNLKDLFFNTTNINIQELDAIKDSIFDFTDEMTTTELINIFKKYLLDPEKKSYDAFTTTDEKINFIKNKFYYKSSQDLSEYFDSFKQDLEELKVNEDTLKEEYKKLLSFLLESSNEQLKKNYQIANEKLDKLKKKTGGKLITKIKEGGGGSGAEAAGAEALPAAKAPLA